MKYELAKELKDNGFPQTGYSSKWATPDAPTPELMSEAIAQQMYAPTLSELIEACNNLTEIKKIAPKRGSLKPRWIAKAYPHLLDVHTEQVQVVGDTPEEAVARLWLALNKN